MSNTSMHRRAARLGLVLCALAPALARGQAAKEINELRNEQRWRQAVEDDALTGENEFSDRVRYLLSLTIPVSGNPAGPSLVLSDEILIQFEPEVVANTFDQNRLSAGIKKSFRHTKSAHDPAGSEE